MDPITAAPVRILQTSELKVCNHSDVIHHIEYDYYSRRLALVSSDKIISIYTKLPHNRGWTKTGQFRVNGGATLRVRWANPVYGQIIASASFDGNIYIFQEHSKFTSSYNYNEMLSDNKGSLITSEWHQKTHLKSLPPTTITDIRFAPHYFGLLLGACNSKGEVFVYEAPSSLILDNWVPVMKLQVFDFRCRAISFSTDRFNTVLMAACTDDDRSRADRQIAIFPYARTCDIGVEVPDITYISPYTGLNVPLPPTDLEFSPTGAYAFQRLAIAVGPCVVIYHINAIPVNQQDEASDSPVSSLSESSANTVVRAPTISISAPKSEEETAEHEEDTHNDSDRPVKEKKRKNSANKQKQQEKIEIVKEKGVKKTVQFKIDSTTNRAGAKSPIPRKPLDSEPMKIKPSLKQPKPIQETDDEKTPIAELSYNFGEICKVSGEASISDDVPVPSLIPIQQLEPEVPKEEEREREEEKADDADSENSETPAPENKVDNAVKEIKSISPIKKRQPENFPPPEILKLNRLNRDEDQRTFYDDIDEDEVSAFSIRQTIPPINRPKQSIFGKDDAPTIGRQDSRNYNRSRFEKNSPESQKSKKINDSEIIKPPEQVAELKRIIKTKPRKRRYIGEAEEHHKSLDEAGSSLSSDSGNNHTLPRTSKKAVETGKNAVKKSPSLQKITTQYHDDNGKISSANIVIRPFDEKGQPLEEVYQHDDDESNRIKLITMRHAILRAGRAQCKNIGFNHTGTLITAIYADGIVRVWKRLNPTQWHCASVIEPPIVKGKEDLEIVVEGAYY